MSESVTNNLNNNERKNQGSGNRECERLQQNFSGGLTVGLGLSNDVESPNYWKNLVAELMKRILSIPLKKPLSQINCLIGLLNATLRFMMGSLFQELED